MRALLKEPLLHFFVAGVALFALHAWINRDEPAAASRPTVVIGKGDVDWLAETWVRQWNRPPSEDEWRGLVNSFLKEQLLAREAVAMGLDEDDTIVRRRLAQKLEFLVQDTARLGDPTEAELRSYYDEHAEAFRTDARFSFAQIYFNPDRRADAASDAQAALRELSRAKALPGDLGDRLMIEADLHDVDERTAAALFGSKFAETLHELERDAWTGPVESGYGLHLVRLGAVQPAAQRPFAEVRDEVLVRWREERSQEAYAAYFADLLEKYEVVVDESIRPLVESLPGLAGARE